MKNFIFTMCFATLLTSASAQSQPELKKDTVETHQKYFSRNKHNGKENRSGDRKHHRNHHTNKRNSKHSEKKDHK